jgi:hypothetical protein
MKNFQKVSFLILPFSFLFSSAKSTVVDTTILHSRSEPGQLQTRIYVSPDKDDWHYDSLKSVTPTYQDEDAQYPYGSWVELKIYKSKYYAYYPCDLGNLRRFAISKDRFRVLGAETDDNRIITSKRLSTGKFSFEIEDPYESKKRTVIFHIIDSKRGLAIVENVGEKQPYKYTLVVNTKELRQYPLIVNECSMKDSEFRFMDPNYASLLKTNLAHPIRNKR